MPGGLTLLASLPAAIPTPPANKITIFFNITAGAPYYKDSTGALFPVVGAPGATGSTGPPGIFVTDGEDGYDGFPGPVTGVLGPTGLTGAAGPIGPVLLQDDSITEEIIYQMLGSVAASPYTNPNLKTWAWTNQGGASVASPASGGIVLTVPTNAALSIRARTTAVPAAPYTAVSAFLATNISPTSGDQIAGIGWSDGTGIILFQVQLNPPQPYLNVVKYTNPTTLSAGYVSAAQPFIISTPIWLKIADDGVNRICSYSVDGENFVTYHTVGRTDFLTATQLLFAASDANATYSMNMKLLSWL